MKKSWVRYLVYSALTIVVILGGITAYLMANKEQIKTYVLKQINAQLDASVTVKDMDITLFRQFPRVSLDMRQVKISDPVHSKKNLLHAQHVYIGFNLYDIIRKQYNIKLVAVDSATITLFTDKKGRSNYLIMKKTESGKQANNSFLLNLKEVKLHHVDVTYDDLKYQQHHDINIEDVTLSGEFNHAGEFIKCSGSVFARNLKSDEIRLVKDKHLVLDLIIKTNHSTQTYTFEKGDIDYDQLKLTIKGEIRNKPSSVFFDLKAGARNLDIPSLLSLVPGNTGLPADLESEGEMHFDGIIKGEADAKHSPEMIFNFGVKNGKLKRKNGLEMEKISFTGQFSNGKMRNQASSVVSIRELSCTINKGTVSGDLLISNFEKPVLNTALRGHVDASDLLAFLQNDHIEQAEGNIQFDIQFNGRISDMNSGSWLNNKTGGTVDLDLKNISFRHHDKKVSRLVAGLSLTSKDASIRKLEAEIDKSDIKVSGTLFNIIPYLLVENETLTANITYQSENLDLNNFMIPVGPVKTDTSKAGFSLPEHIIIDADVSTKNLTYNLFTAKNVTASVRWKGKQISVENLSAHTMDGTLKVDGQIENAPDGRFLVSASTNLENIDINKLFIACNDFGQEEITRKHIHGKLSGTVDLVSVWSNNLDCDFNKLYALAKIQVTNGELNGYKPLEALGKYVDVNELRNLRFADLKNTIEIRKQTIHIPGFEVKNNALNLTLSGTHTFANYIDYKVKIKINELLRKKRKQDPANEFNEEETNDRGANLYLSMKGPIDDFKITYDKVGVKQKINEDLKQEKQNIKEILKKELGISDERKKDIKEKQDDSDELEFEPE